jgi:filamentous hemagglutinin family protein
VYYGSLILSIPFEGLMKTKKLYAIVSTLLVSNIAVALPSGGSVAAGSATISQTNTQTTINQTTQNAVINWNGFDTSSNQSVVFNQPNSNSNTLNRINSGLPTNFAGSLTANGNVYILNSSGILFAAGSKVDVSGLVVTTLNAKDDEFMSGHFNLVTAPGHENATIINNGTITAQSFAELLGPNVSNGKAGVIQADLGLVTLTSGGAFVLDFNNDGVVNFQISGAAKNGHLENAGLIKATGGMVVMSMDSVSNVLDNMISMSGVIEANTASTGQHGIIILGNSNGAGVSVSGSIVADQGSVVLYSVSGEGQIIPGKADAGINISGSITSGAIYMGTSGAVIETDTGKMTANVLDTIALNGVMLNFHNNLGAFDPTGGGVVQIQNNQLHFDLPGDN